MNNFPLLLPAMLLAFLCCYFYVGYLVRYALTHQLLDHPNDRSSHQLPTPRGGGLAIAVTLILAIIALTFTNQISYREMLGFGGAGLLVAFIGWLDDRRHLSVRIRLPVHFLAAIWALYWLDIFNDFPNTAALLQSLMYCGGLLYLVWMLNLYNFMDGIDGIAGIEAVTVGLGFCLITAYSGELTDTAVITLFLIVSVSGFLLWNFPKAKIFMGDVGSGFIGLMLGLLSLHAGLVEIELFWSWVILLGVFVVDASYTLAMRILRKEKFYEAHCNHAYQHAARRFASHVRVSLGIGLINLVWLLPVAFAVSKEILTPVIGIAVAYSPLVLLAIYFRAGQPAIRQ